MRCMPLCTNCGIDVTVCTHGGLIIAHARLGNPVDDLEILRLDKVCRAKHAQRPPRSGYVQVPFWEINPQVADDLCGIIPAEGRFGVSGPCP